jgi:rod shape-determining protein MreD
LNNIHVRYFLLFAVALVFQVTLVKYIEIFYWRPDLLLIVLVSYSLRVGPNYGMTAGFLVGLVQDALSTHFLGLAALSKTLAGFIAGSLTGKFARRTEFLLVLLICGLLHDFVYFLIYTLGESFSFQNLFFLYTIPNVAYTLLVGGILHFLIETWIKE